jgi:hypothetical protein
MAAIITWLSGRKTFCVVIAGVVLGVCQGLGLFTVPNSVWAIIGSLGLGSMRLAVAKSQAATTSVEGVVRDVVNSLAAQSESAPADALPPAAAPAGAVVPLATPGPANYSPPIENPP